MLVGGTSRPAVTSRSADAATAAAPGSQGGRTVATVEECGAALDRLAARLGGGGSRGLDRTLSCSVTDLGTTFHGRLTDGQLIALTTEPHPAAQIRLTTTSDDLIALTSGHLNPGSAWASGRLKIEAGMRDLMRLRSMF